MAPVTSLVLILFPFLGDSSFMIDFGLLRIRRSHDPIVVQGIFPSCDDLIFERLSAEMTKNSASIDGVKKNGGRVL
jgi:hypothetical protein